MPYSIPMPTLQRERSIDQNSRREAFRDQSNLPGIRSSSRNGIKATLVAVSNGDNVKVKKLPPLRNPEVELEPFKLGELDTTQGKENNLIDNPPERLQRTLQVRNYVYPVNNVSILSGFEILDFVRNLKNSEPCRVCEIDGVNGTAVSAEIVNRGGGADAVESTTDSQRVSAIQLFEVPAFHVAALSGDDQGFYDAFLNFLCKKISDSFFAEAEASFKKYASHYEESDLGLRNDLGTPYNDLISFLDGNPVELKEGDCLKNYLKAVNSTMFPGIIEGDGAELDHFDESKMALEFDLISTLSARFSDDVVTETVSNTMDQIRILVAVLGEKKSIIGNRLVQLLEPCSHESFSAIGNEAPSTRLVIKIKNPIFELYNETVESRALFHKPDIFDHSILAEKIKNWEKLATSFKVFMCPTKKGSNSFFEALNIDLNHFKKLYESSASQKRRKAVNAKQNLFNIHTNDFEEFIKILTVASEILLKGRIIVFEEMTDQSCKIKAMYPKSDEPISKNDYLLLSRDIEEVGRRIYKHYDRVLLKGKGFLPKFLIQYGNSHVDALSILLQKTRVLSELPDKKLDLSARIDKMVSAQGCVSLALCEENNFDTVANYFRMVLMDGVEKGECQDLFGGSFSDVIDSLGKYMNSSPIEDEFDFGPKEENYRINEKLMDAEIGDFYLKKIAELAKEKGNKTNYGTVTMENKIFRIHEYHFGNTDRLFMGYHEKSDTHLPLFATGDSEGVKYKHPKKDFTKKYKEYLKNHIQKYINPESGISINLS